MGPWFWRQLPDNSLFCPGKSAVNKCDKPQLRKKNHCHCLTCMSTNTSLALHSSNFDNQSFSFLKPSFKLNRTCFSYRTPPCLFQYQRIRFQSGKVASWTNLTTPSPSLALSLSLSLPPSLSLSLLVSLCHRPALWPLQLMRNIFLLEKGAMQHHP